jgi:hypothetical protein
VAVAERSGREYLDLHLPIKEPVGQDLLAASMEPQQHMQQVVHMELQRRAHQTLVQVVGLAGPAGPV